MTARTVVQTISGATLAISATLPATYDVAGYNGSNQIYTAIGWIENYGNHGVVGNVVEFTPVDTATVNKAKGSKNYGTMTLTIGSVPGDAGQVILLAASESNNHYSFKLTYPDGEIHYIDAIVSRFEYVDGSVDSNSAINCELAICRKPIVQVAA